LTQYPSEQGHEDFVTLVESEAGIGWTAVTRAAQNDIVVVLKDSAVMPRPDGFDGVKMLEIDQDRLILTALNGIVAEIPFDSGYFAI
jgi:hypothetical protein